MRRRWAPGLLAAWVITWPASSETRYFTQPEAFFEAAGRVELGSFEDLPVCLALECRGDRLEQPGFTLNLSSRPADYLYVEDRVQFGLTPTNGDNFVYVSIAAGNLLRFVFREPTRVFAVSVSDYGDFLPGTGTLDFANEIGNEAVIVGGQPSGRVNFFGVVNSDQAFQTVDLTSNSSGEAFGLDEVYSAPEPLASAGGIAAVAALAALRRRAKKPG